MTTPEGVPVHIDTRMVPLIANLWNARIETLFCCGGSAPYNPHRTKNRFSSGIAYIVLRDQSGLLFDALTRRVDDHVKLSRNNDRTCLYWSGWRPVDVIQQLILDANRAAGATKEESP